MRIGWSQFCGGICDVFPIGGCGGECDRRKRRLGTGDFYGDFEFGVNLTV